MERPSLSMAIFLVVLILALALLPSNNIDQAQAAAAKAKRGGTPELIPINLVGRDGDKITLALQPRDLSLASFANGSHHWYAFPGYEHVIRNGTTLPFGNSYRDLIGGLANLPSLPLGREPVLRAIGAISACDDPASADDDTLGALKRGLATLTVTRCEALRLAPVWETVSESARTNPNPNPSFPFG
ncbi:beta-galactoside-specific lectin 2-like [Miscanthus floridulus]|uniref:beta-galactoside-specific lectin 2-like n=1 Tax=Miscanthus floridulus TaxID=154761 RepID=UPI003458CF66